MVCAQCYHRAGWKGGVKKKIEGGGRGEIGEGRGGDKSDHCCLQNLDNLVLSFILSDKLPRGNSGTLRKKNK